VRSTNACARPPDPRRGGSEEIAPSPTRSRSACRRNCGSAKHLLRSFTGEAPLGAWLRIIAYREGVDLRRHREVASDDHLVERVIGATEPELALLRASYVAVFKRSFARAFAALSLHDRDLVRRHHLDGLTLDQLASLFSTHRATVARWLARIRATLVTATRDALSSELSEAADLDDVLALIASKLEASLSREP
jgi:RNA polymerase sigma-70 factor (ECF subfamily)